jgi:hypothetical protein
MESLAGSPPASAPMAAVMKMAPVVTMSRSPPTIARVGVRAHSWTAGRGEGQFQLLAQLRPTVTSRTPLVSEPHRVHFKCAQISYQPHRGVHPAALQHNASSGAGIAIGRAGSSKTAASIRRPRRSWQAIHERLLAGLTRPRGAMMNADLRSERAYFKEKMRRRLDLIAADYGVPAWEVAKVRGRLKHDDALCFAQSTRSASTG